jgi:hypothetical protein
MGACRYPAHGRSQCARLAGLIRVAATRYQRGIIFKSTKTNSAAADPSARVFRVSSRHGRVRQHEYKTKSADQAKIV